jgi:hypothetical protein
MLQRNGSASVWCCPVTAHRHVAHGATPQRRRRQYLQRIFLSRLVEGDAHEFARLRRSQPIMPPRYRPCLLQERRDSFSPPPKSSMMIISFVIQILMFARYDAITVRHEANIDRATIQRE